MFFVSDQDEQVHCVKLNHNQYLRRGSDQKIVRRPTLPTYMPCLPWIQANHLPVSVPNAIAWNPFQYWSYVTAYPSLLGERHPSTVTLATAQMSAPVNHNGTDLANSQQLTQYFTCHYRSRKLQCINTTHRLVRRHNSALDPKNRQLQLQPETLPWNYVVLDAAEVLPPHDHRSFEVMGKPEFATLNNQVKCQFFQSFQTHHAINSATENFNEGQGIRGNQYPNDTGAGRGESGFSIVQNSRQDLPVATIHKSPQEQYEGIMHRHNVMNYVLNIGNGRQQLMNELSPAVRPALIQESLQHPVEGPNNRPRNVLMGSYRGICCATKCATKFNPSITTATIHPPIIDPSFRRRIGKMRCYNSKNKSFEPWKDINMPIATTASSAGAKHTTTIQKEQEFPIALSRGGELKFYSGFIPTQKRLEIARAMHQCKLFRQYSFSGIFHEPRSHVLLSSRARASVCATDAAATGIVEDNKMKLKSGRMGQDCEERVDARGEHPGYSYHGIKMRAQPIDLIPEVACYAEELARLYDLPNNEWNIGVDLIAYKDGEDSIGWHSDDTQGESIVLCVVIDSPGEPRPLLIRPKKNHHMLREGDEEIELEVREGDAYNMDGWMQIGYEHSLPKKKKNTNHRFVLIFRHGNVASVSHDSGVSIIDLAKTKYDRQCLDCGVLHDGLSSQEDSGLVPLIRTLRVKRPSTIFGRPTYEIAEGEDGFSRRYLYSVGAHLADQKGVNGNSSDGCDSIVVSRQSPMHRETDGLNWFTYTSSRKQGGGALFISYLNKSPIRVFRSSDLDSPFAPPTRKNNLTNYRYDGLYTITKAWDSKGNKTDEDIPVGGTQYTFLLARLNSKTVVVPQADARNELNASGIWSKIQLSHGQKDHIDFVWPHPDLTILPVLPNDIFDESASIVNNAALEAAKSRGEHDVKDFILSTLRKAIAKIEQKCPQYATRYNESAGDSHSSTRNDIAHSLRSSWTGTIAIPPNSYYSFYSQRQNCANYLHCKADYGCEQRSYFASNHSPSGNNNQNKRPSKDIECLNCGPIGKTQNLHTGQQQRYVKGVTEYESVECDKKKERKESCNGRRSAVKQRRSLQLGRWIFQSSISHSTNDDAVPSGRLNEMKLEWRAIKSKGNQTREIMNQICPDEAYAGNGIGQLEMITASIPPKAKSVECHEKMSLDDRWKRRHSELKLLVARRGQPDIKTACLGNRRLTSWVNRQRSLYRANQAGKVTTLTQDRIALLNHLGFDWNPKKVKVPRPHSAPFTNDTFVSHITKNKQAYRLIKDFSYRYRHSKKNSYCIGSGVFDSFVDFSLSLSSMEIRKQCLIASSPSAAIDTKRKREFQQEKVLSSSSSKAFSNRPIRPRFLAISEANYQLLDPPLTAQVYLGRRKTIIKLLKVTLKVPVTKEKNAEVAAATPDDLGTTDLVEGVATINTAKPEILRMEKMFYRSSSNLVLPNTLLDKGGTGIYDSAVSITLPTTSGRSQQDTSNYDDINNIETERSQFPTKQQLLNTPHEIVALGTPLEHVLTSRLRSKRKRGLSEAHTIPTPHCRMRIGGRLEIVQRVRIRWR